MTQASRLILAIRQSGKRGLTYGQLQDLHISTSPQKRLAESGYRYLRPGERLERRTASDGLVRFVVTK